MTFSFEKRYLREGVLLSQDGNTHLPPQENQTLPAVHNLPSEMTGHRLLCRFREIPGSSHESVRS